METEAELSLSEQLEVMLAESDYSGAETILERMVEANQWNPAVLHLQFGRLYKQWNKLTSALNHLVKAAELANRQADELLVMQIREEIRFIKRHQSAQCP